jgi:hypothetical protein
MAQKHFSRRAFLLSSAALGGAIAAVGHATQAGAFAFETVSPQSAIGVAFSNRCGSDSEHARLQALLEQELAKQSGTPGTYLTRQTICPICGCPITATRYIPKDL